MIAVMPEFASDERKLVMKAYGAGFVLTPKEKGIGEILVMKNKIVKL